MFGCVVIFYRLVRAWLLRLLLVVCRWRKPLSFGPKNQTDGNVHILAVNRHTAVECCGGTSGSHSMQWGTHRADAKRNTNCAQRFDMFVIDFYGGRAAASLSHSDGQTGLNLCIAKAHRLQMHMEAEPVSERARCRLVVCNAFIECHYAKAGWRNHAESVPLKRNPTTIQSGGDMSNR